MELFVAVCLVVIGLAVGLLGLKLFRILLPIAGLALGAVIGFTGIQGVFGTGPASTTVAVLTAIVFALVLAVLSYAFLIRRLQCYWEWHSRRCSRCLVLCLAYRQMDW